MINMHRRFCFKGIAVFAVCIFAQFALQGKLSHQFDFRDDSSFIIISDTFTFVGYKYKVSVIQAILWSMLSKVFISFRFILPNGQEDHAGESRGQLITSLLASRTLH